MAGSFWKSVLQASPLAERYTVFDIVLPNLGVNFSYEPFFY